jgi:catechol 2,3-dioxygenase-like lactoylglutathione lyase family enzyme
MPSEAGNAVPALSPQQVCFVVDDVSTAVKYCEENFGWGPFYQFKVPVPEAHYKDWSGEKLTEVALGMAGKVQMEFLHVFTGHDTTEEYQAHYGTGFQHLGIHCEGRDEALAFLESLGAQVNELNEYPGIRFAFVDVPTGPGMFEILQPTAEMASNAGISGSRKSGNTSENRMEVDRATIVTRDIDAALDFYAAAFGWTKPVLEQSNLRYGEHETQVLRHIATAGTLELEFIQPKEGSDDPYAAHLRRGEHGLIHAGGMTDRDFPEGATMLGEWLDNGESFALYNWPGGNNALQVRRLN